VIVQIADERSRTMRVIAGGDTTELDTWGRSRQTNVGDTGPPPCYWLRAHR